MVVFDPDNVLEVIPIADTCVVLISDDVVRGDDVIDSKRLTIWPFLVFTNGDGNFLVLRI